MPWKWKCNDMINMSMRATCSSVQHTKRKRWFKRVIIDHDQFTGVGSASRPHGIKPLVSISNERQTQLRAVLLSQRIHLSAVHARMVTLVDVADGEV